MRKVKSTLFQTFLPIFTCIIVLTTLFAFTPALKSTVVTDASLQSKLMQAPNQITYKGDVYTLDAYAWRNYMPPVTPEGRPMSISTKLIHTGNQAVPKTITIGKLYAIQGNDIWISDYDMVKATRFPSSIEKTAHDGPRWSPNSTVDIVVQLLDRTTYTSKFIKITQVPVQAVQ